MSARRIDKVIGLAVLVLAVLLALLPLLIGSPPDAEDGSVAANEQHGRRALYLLVKELGLAPEAWNQPPGRLPRGEHFVWLARAPQGWAERQPKKHSVIGSKKPAKELKLPEPDRAKDGRKGIERAESGRTEGEHKAAGRKDAEHKEALRPDTQHSDTESTDTERTESAHSDPEPVDAQDEERADGDRAKEKDESADATPPALEAQRLTHYRRFVEEGGTLVMRYDERARQFLSRDLALDAFQGLELDAEAPAGDRRIHTESGEDLDVDWPKGAVFRAVAPNGPVRALWTAARSDAERDEVLAVIAPVGSGRILLLGDDAFLDNAKLGQKDHALLAVRLAEHRAPGGRLLFDEFALGLWQPETATGLATSPPLFLITVHLALLVCLFVWAKGWVSTFPRDPPALARVSPLSRARARARLCERARRYDLLAGMLRRGSTRRWLALARLRPIHGGSSGRGSSGRGSSGGGSSKPDPSTSLAASDPTEAEIARIAASIGSPQSSQGWREAALERRVANAAELETLARDLDRIEAEIEAGERRNALRAG